MPSGLTPSYGLVQSSIRAQIARSQAQPFSSLEQARSAVSEMIPKLRLFAGLLSEADALELRTVTAMSAGRRRSHGQSDEGRSVGGSFEIKFDQDILQAIIRQWTPVARSIKIGELDKAIPNGTSLGWPFLFQDSSDNVRTFFLGAMALAIERDKMNGLSLKEIYGQLVHHYGSRMIVPGWRLQHTSKPIPAYADNRFLWTQNVEPRARLIAMVDKLAIIYNRDVAKTIVAAALRLPQHNQDRPYLKTVFDRWKRTPGTKIVAVDVSGFDNGFGGANLETLLSVAHQITGIGRHEDLVQEVSAPMLVPFGRDVLATQSRVTPQLPSGASFTTGVGLLAGDYIALKLAKILNLQLGPAPNQMEYVNWGDDFGIRVPDHVGLDAAFQALSEHTGLSFDFEPTIKYLGFVYGSGRVQAFEGYSQGRLILKTLFPERPTAPPFSTIGYIARLQFVQGDAEAYHKIFVDNFWQPRFGPPFAFKDKDVVLRDALQKAALTSDYDRDALNFLLHGLQPSEASTTSGHLLSALGIDFDFSTWIGGAYVDLTDPMKVISSQSPALLANYANLLKIVNQTGTRGLVPLATALAARYNWRQSNSGVSPIT